MFLLINKASGPSSHNIVAKLRGITSLKRIGHAGTLDPFAEGLLVIAIKRDSTKKLTNLLKLDKTYEATLKLGATTDTYDKTGTIKKGKEKNLNLTEIKKVLKSFEGDSLQTPPDYSAKKINGKKAYELARKGKTVNLQKQKITIDSIKLKKFDNKKQTLSIEVNCSSGTYIRSLAADIGKALGTGAYLTKLVRTRIGPFKLSSAIHLGKLNSKNWIKHTFNNLPKLKVKKRILVFGTFDKLHPGHKSFFNQALKLAEELYVILARDKNVKNLKGKTPHHSELKRVESIRKLNLTKQVNLGSENWINRYRIINKIKPDIIALGYDQKVNLTELRTKLEKYGLKPEIIRLKPHKPSVFKSSLIKS